MIFDNTQILLDGLPIAANEKKVNTRFDMPARFDIPFFFSVEDTINQSVTFELFEADSEDGTYTAVADTKFTLSGDNLKKGVGKAPYKILPNTVKKSWIRLDVTSTTAPTAGKVLVGLVREFDEPYTDGQYINKGEVIG